MVWHRKYHLGMILFACCAIIALNRTAVRGDTQAQSGCYVNIIGNVPVLIAREVASCTVNYTVKLEYKSKEWYREEKKLNVMLWASIAIVTISFTGFILITVIRMSRRYRQRVTGDKGPEPTEYVDAWSQYRLPEEDNDEDRKNECTHHD